MNFIGFDTVHDKIITKKTNNRWNRYIKTKKDHSMENEKKNMKQYGTCIFI